MRAQGARESGEQGAGASRFGDRSRGRSRGRAGDLSGVSRWEATCRDTEGYRVAHIARHQPRKSTGRILVRFDKPTHERVLPGWRFGRIPNQVHSHTLRQTRSAKCVMVPSSRLVLSRSPGMPISLYAHETGLPDRGLRPKCVKMLLVRCFA